MRFNLKRPCENCPFKSDVGFLCRSRADEILSAVLYEGKTFTCHKTLGKKKIEQSHCAGALIMLEQNKSREETDNQMVQIAIRLGLYDQSIIDMSSDVHTPDSFLEAHQF